MRQLNNIRLLLMAICTVFMLGSCSDFPDELYFDGEASISPGLATYDLETNTYSQEFIVDIKIKNASEPIQHARVFFSGDTEKDITNQINLKKGGKFVVDNIPIDRYAHSANLELESANYKYTTSCHYSLTPGSLCKVSNFDISFKEDPMKGADVTFHIDNNPLCSSYPIVIKVIDAEKETNVVSYVISQTSVAGDYHYKLNNIDFDKVYKCALYVDGSRVSDIIEYRTPKSKATIEASYHFTESRKQGSGRNAYTIYYYKLSFYIPNFDSIPGEKVIKVWKRRDSETSFTNLIATESGIDHYEQTFIHIEDDPYVYCVYRAELYVNGDRWAVTDCNVSY